MLRKIAVAGLCLATTAHSAAVDQLQKRDGAGGHHDHSDSGAYGAPPAAYEAPAAEYGAPAATYEQPADSYGVSYGGYEEETLPDLTPIIVGILVLTGLSLLFPTFVSLTSVRRKRHAEDGKKAIKMEPACMSITILESVKYSFSILYEFPPPSPPT